MTQEEYYTTPPQEIFDDIKENALKIWNLYTDPYRSEKINRIKDLKNVQDNAWYMVAMFDSVNQARLLAVVRPGTADMIRDARGY